MLFPLYNNTFSPWEAMRKILGNSEIETEFFIIGESGTKRHDSSFKFEDPNVNPIKKNKLKLV